MVSSQQKHIRILHVSEYCHAGSTGGTERYLLELIRGLHEHGIASVIGWLCSDESKNDVFECDGVRITPVFSPAARIDSPVVGLPSRVARVLDREGSDLLHFHTFGMAEAEVARVAYGKEIPYVFTYHSPAWSCRRGDLLRWGTQVCDGAVRPWRCSACMIQQRLGCPKRLAWAAAFLSPSVGLFGRFLSGKLHRRTAFVEDTARFRKALREFLGNAAAVVACCEWSIPVLARNGAPRDRIVHCPQGVPMDFVRAAAGPRPEDGGVAELLSCQGAEGGPAGSRAAEQAVGGRSMIAVAASAGSAIQRTDNSTTQQPNNPTTQGLFTVGYVGRVTWVKGVHILVEAFARTSYANARLRIYGCDDSRSGTPYRRRLKEQAGDDPRIEFIPKLPFDAMLAAYRTLDLLAIPSISLETGPLTLLEAVALGVEVWGSDTVGQMAVLKEHGRLIVPNLPESWHSALRGAFARHQQGAWRNPQPVRVRSMSDVAKEICGLYALSGRTVTGIDPNGLSYSPMSGRHGITELAAGIRGTCMTARGGQALSSDSGGDRSQSVAGCRESADSPETFVEGHQSIVPAWGHVSGRGGSSEAKARNPR